MVAADGRSTSSLDNVATDRSPSKPGARAWSVVAAVCESVNVDESPTVVLRQLAQFSQPCAHLYAALYCDSEICNGGFLQLFWNPTGVLAPEAALGVAAMGLGDVSGTVEQAMRFFGEPYPRSFRSRRDVLTACDADYPRAKNPFAALDDKYFSLRPWQDDVFEKAADEYSKGIVV